MRRRGSRLLRAGLRTAGSAAVLAGLLAAAAAPVAGQAPPRAPRIAIDTRAAFLITRTEGFDDRPVLAADLRLVIVQPHPGGGPGLGVMAGGAIGFADIFGEVQSESHRLTGGVEFPFAVATAGGDRPPIEIVPLFQAGRLDSNGGDHRSGFVGRAALGLRIPLGAGGTYLGFEPFSLTLLPDPDVESSGPSSRLAYEVGILRVGWSF